MRQRSLYKEDKSLPNLDSKIRTQKAIVTNILVRQVKMREDQNREQDDSYCFVRGYN